MILHWIHAWAEKELKSASWYIMHMGNVVTEVVYDVKHIHSGNKNAALLSAMLVMREEK